LVELVQPSVERAAAAVRPTSRNSSNKIYFCARGRGAGDIPQFIVIEAVPSSMVWFVPLLWKAAVIIPTAVYAIFTPFTSDDFYFFSKSKASLTKYFTFHFLPTLPVCSKTIDVAMKGGQYYASWRKSRQVRF
jgi:hypothetical protein